MVGHLEGFPSGTLPSIPCASGAVTTPQCTRSQDRSTLLTEPRHRRLRISYRWHCGRAGPRGQHDVLEMRFTPEGSEVAEAATAGGTGHGLRLRCHTLSVASRPRPHVGEHRPKGHPMANERTGPKAAKAAAKTLTSPSASKSAKSAAGSALAQARTSKVTSKSAVTKAAKTLSSPTASKAAKSAAGSALTQRPGGRKR